MKIIKPGKIKNTVTCEVCECVYEFDVEDIFYHMPGFSHYVKCPMCSYKHKIEGLNYPNQYTGPVIHEEAGVCEPNIKLMKENENGSIK